MRTVTFQNVTPTDESAFESYAVWMTGGEIAELYDDGQITMDKDFQRGFITSSDKAAAGALIPVHDRPSNRKHINSISDDLVAQVGLTKRSKAVIPPIWLNIRLDDGSSEAVYDDIEDSLKIQGFMYTVDGYHRIRSIFDAVTNKGLDKQRKFLIYVTHGPKSFEAYLFNLLNGESLKVDPTRIAWVAAPFENGYRRLIYEMAIKSKNLSRVNNLGEREYNFETARSASPNTSTTYCNFRSLIDSMGIQGQNLGQTVWAGFTDLELNISNPYMMDLLSTYLAQYFDYFCKIRPELGFLDVKSRVQTKTEVRYLVNKVTARAVIWLGMLLLSASNIPSTVNNLREKLETLTSNDQLRQQLFQVLDSFKATNTLDFFSTTNSNWIATETESQDFIKDRYQDRVFPLKRMVDHLGGLKPNSILVHLKPIQKPEITMATTRKKAAVKSKPIGKKEAWRREQESKKMALKN